MQTNIECNLHNCHMIPTVSKRDWRLKCLNINLLIHLFLLFVYLSTYARISRPQSGSNSRHLGCVSESCACRHRCPCLVK